MGERDGGMRRHESYTLLCPYSKTPSTLERAITKSSPIRPWKGEMHFPHRFPMLRKLA